MQSAAAARDGSSTLPWGKRDIRLKRAFFTNLANASSMEAVANYDWAILAAAGSRDQLVTYVTPICDAATRTRRRERRVIEGADHFFNAIDPKSSLAEPLFAETAAFFATALNA